ncbi:MAG: hypothetical protein JWM50_1616 [Microbacteriaceae bacterium]|jgi:hypothetical protein|nr:hypothetical protein [Microbacteriaceae bacterium]
MAALEAATQSATRLDTVRDAAADAPWTAPTHLGPIPGELRERADRLLVDQRASIRNLEDLHRETGRHLAAVRAVPSPRDGQSVYLDVSG